MMEEYLYVAHEFRREVLPEKRISNREFDRCEFVGCDFAGTEFIDCIFTDCVFTDCNLSMCHLPGTTLQQCLFVRCKLLGIRFDRCNPILFSPSFEACSLDFSWFEKMKMPGINFTDCSLRGVNFSGAALQNASMADAQLQEAIFDGTDLSGADLSSAHNISIDPERNVLTNAKFSINNIDGLLSRYEIKIV